MSSGMMLDKSLDSIIAEKKKGGPKKRTARRSGTGAHAAKAKLVGKGGLPAAAAAKRRASAPGATDTPASSSTTMAVKIIISNLPTDVNEAQIKDLFASTVGPVKTCSLQYNAGGKSSGTATVVFNKQGDAQKAFDAYNNRLIDGSQFMIQFYSFCRAAALVRLGVCHDDNVHYRTRVVDVPVLSVR